MYNMAYVVLTTALVVASVTFCVLCVRIGRRLKKDAPQELSDSPR